MCTVFYLAQLGLLSKNRDKETPEQEEFINTGNYIALRTIGTDYFSLGLNREGCCFVSTAVNDVDWTAAIERGDQDQAKHIWQAETEGLESPTKLISETLEQVCDIQDWVDHLQSQNKQWRAYNAILVDKNGGIHLEFHGREIVVRELDSRDVVTNHFKTIQYGASRREEYLNSFERFEYAWEKIEKISDRKDLFEAAHPESQNDRARIWRQDSFRTISSTILDFKNCALYYTPSIDESYQLHTLA